MRGKFWIWLGICLIASMAAGVVSYYFIKPYLPKTLSLDFVKGGPNTTANGTQKPFSGWLEHKRQRALAVVIDNIPEAGTQSGLENADVVIDLPVEGGLTRLLAIITGDNIEQVGPIRSLRPAMVELAKEYNAILVHAGGSYDGLAALEREKPDNLDEIQGGPKVEAAFWRLTDRPKPHNLFASTDSLRRASQDMKYNLKTPPAKREYLAANAEITGDPAGDITILNANRQAKVRYVYNQERQVYERFRNDKPHLGAKNEQLVTANIIIQYVPFRYIDGDGRLQLIMHGDGEALVFRGGKAVKGIWQKMPGGFTRFTDSKGNEISLAPGPTWIEVLKKGTQVDF